MSAVETAVDLTNWSQTKDEPNEKVFVNGDDHREDESIALKSSSVGWQFVHAPPNVDLVNGAETETVHTNQELFLNALRSAETYLENNE